MSDEDLDICMLERLQERYFLSEAVQPVDGGTLDLELFSYLEEAHRLLGLDTAGTAGSQDTLLRVAGDAVLAFLGMHVSPQEMGLANLLAVARDGAARTGGPWNAVESVELGWEH